MFIIWPRESKSEKENTISPNVFLEIQFVFLGQFQQLLLYFTKVYNCVTGSDGLKLLYNVEMNIRIHK
jgi:hypothetical protein